MEERTFGERLRAIREGRLVRDGERLSLRELADLTGISAPHLSQIENGHRWGGRLPPHDDLRRMAAALEISVAELTGEGQTEAETRAMDEAAEHLEAAREFIEATPKERLRALSGLPGMPDMTDPERVASVLAFVEANPGRGFRDRLERQRARRSRIGYTRLRVNIFTAWCSNENLGLSAAEDDDVGHSD